MLLLSAEDAVTIILNRATNLSVLHFLCRSSLLSLNNTEQRRGQIQIFRDRVGNC